MNEVRSVEELEAVVGKKPPALDLKVVDHIDASAKTWLSRATLAFVCLGASDGLAITLAGGPAGFATGGDHRLSIPIESFDDRHQLHEGLAFGALWLVPSMRETLRLNGRIERIEAKAVTISISECFLHCAKALIRSDFWSASPLRDEIASVEDFFAKARFLALGTVGEHFAADLSPKGDPAGLLVKRDGDLILFADRPGNRRTDSFRNILVKPHMAGALLIPGSHQIVDFVGKAELSSDQKLCAQFTVDGKAPKLVTKVGAVQLLMRLSPALEAAKPWPAAPAPRDLDPAAIFAAHMRLSKDRSFSARFSKAMVSVPGLMSSALKSDYKKNLY